MPKTACPKLWLLLCVLLAICGKPVAGQVVGVPGEIVRIYEDIDVDDLGNITGRADMVLSPAQYQRLKNLVTPQYTVQENGQAVVKTKPPKVEKVLRYLGLTSTALEIQDVKGEFDDEAATIRMSYRVVGRLAYIQGRWSLNLATDSDAKIDIRRSEIKEGTVDAEFRTRQGGLLYINSVKVHLPKNAAEIELRPKLIEIVFIAPAPKKMPEKPASRPDMRFEAKPQLMSALYKQYGNPKWVELWAGRSVFRNNTAETLTGFRSRFRIEGYSNWTLWKRSDKVYPGQTVVDAYYPIIEAKIAELKGSTPAHVELEYEYTRPSGEKVTDGDAQLVRILGTNEALWSSLEADEDSTWYDIFRNGPMVLATYTSAEDPVVQDVLGMISKATGGAGASINDESALRFLGTLYNLLRENVAYETTPGGMQPDGLLHQHLKFGRDVMRTRSGTCVNLAIFYASVCEAAGLQAYIIMGPGHAFPAAKLPQSGLMVYVESTGCGGGTKESSMTFVQAREQAFKTYQRWWNEGIIQETDIRAARQSGIASPELPNLGAAPLKEWGIRQPEAADQVYLPKLLVTVKSALDSVQLNYQALSDRPAVQLAFKTQAGNEWNTFVQTLEDTEMMLMMSQVPGKVPEDQRTTVAAALNDLNVETMHGNFEISAEGAIAYRTTTAVREGLLLPRMVLNDLDHHFNTMEKHLSALREYATEMDATQTQEEPQETAAAEEPEMEAPPEDSPLIGQWLTVLNDADGSQRAQGIEFKSDGTYRIVASNGSGGTIEVNGQWSFQDNVLKTISDTQQTNARTVTIVDADTILIRDDTLDRTLAYSRAKD